MKKIVLVALCLISTIGAMAQKSKSVFIQKKDGKTIEIPANEVDSIYFGNSARLIQTDAKFSEATYHGNAFGTGVGVYTVMMSDKTFATGELDALPILQIAFATDIAPSASAMDIPAGTYNLSKNSSEKGVAVQRFTYYIDENGVRIAFKRATVNVEKKGTDYAIRLSGYLVGDTVRVEYTFNGAINFNYSPQLPYEPLSSDVTMVPTQGVGVYTTLDNDVAKAGNYTFTLFNTPFNSEGVVDGDGEILNIELLTNLSKPMNLDDLTGEYEIVMPVAGATYKPGHFIGGLYNTDYAVPMGTYLNYIYDFESQETYSEQYGFIASGTIKAKHENGVVNLQANLLTAEGKRITLNYDVPEASFMDNSGSESGAPKKAKKLFFAKKNLKKVSVK
ncbi:MAG: hypothetical protein SOZ07_02900 [Prevotella sp.]|nr:hypothetical protein [Prevotellaceae bacterium]MDY3935594.1 hypothetical protein [Prevotella sp.]